jgi:hypothetical protein
MIVIDRKKIIIASLIVLAIIVALTIYFVIAYKNKTDTGKLVITSYVDQYSGETVSEQKNGNSKNITMLGFIKLIDIGVSSDQVKVIKTEFESYAKSQKESVSQISIDASTVTSSINRDTGERMISFTVVINQKTKLKAKVVYKGFEDPNLTLYDQGDNQLYKSS